MTSKEEINQILTDDVSILENKINNIEFVNKKNKILKALVKIGIKLESARPYITAAILTFYLNPSMINNPPFFLNDLKIKEQIETIDTSSGFYEEKRSFDKEYKEEKLQYSTGWIKNKNGLYERTIISYKLIDDIDLNNKEEILSMSKDQLQQLLQITNVETIKKSHLDEDDELFMEESIIIINHTTSNNTKIVKETNEENYRNSIVFLLLVAIIGLGLHGIKNIFTKNKIKDKLEDIEESLKPINEEELKLLKKLLLLKKENLSLLEGQEKPKQYRRLRKDQNR